MTDKELSSALTSCSGWDWDKARGAVVTYGEEAQTCVVVDGLANDRDRISRDAMTWQCFGSFLTLCFRAPSTHGVLLGMLIEAYDAVWLDESDLNEGTLAVGRTLGEWLLYSLKGKGVHEATRAP